MGELEPRNPAIDAIALVFVALDVEAVTPETAAESFGLRYPVVRKAFEEAASRGYVNGEDGTYWPTKEGLDAVMTRGPGTIDAAEILEPAFDAIEARSQD